MLPENSQQFNKGLKKLNVEYSTSFRICPHKIRGIRDCIESQTNKKIHLFIFDSDTLDTYDYSVIRSEKKYKDRIEIPYTMAVNDSNLIIEYP